MRRRIAESAFLSVTAGEGGVEVVVAAVDEVVESRCAEYEEPLQQEVPEYRHDN